MKSTYKRKISRKEKWWIGVAVFVFAGMIVANLYLVQKNSWIFQAVWWLLYCVIFSYIYLKVPVAKINYNTNRLIIGSRAYINIHQIISLEAIGKKGMKVRYRIFNDMERSSNIPPVSDEDKPRLLADLLQINPDIVILPTS